MLATNSMHGVRWCNLQSSFLLEQTLAGARMRKMEGNLCSVLNRRQMRGGMAEV